MRTGPDRSADSIDAGTTLLALVEVHRFEAFKRTVGVGAASDTLAGLAARISRHPACREARADRHYVKTLFACPAGADPVAMLQALAADVAGPIDYQGYVFDLVVRIGAVLCLEGGPSDAQLGAAERALAQAAERHQSVALAGPEDESSFANRLGILRGLQEAMREDRLELHYQPKIRGRSGEVAGLEALVRWHDPVVGMIPPDRFIGLAEESGDIARLTEWVIGRAIADQGRLIDMGHTLPIDVNISGTLITAKGFAWDTLMQFTAVRGEIGFEITETAMIADPKIALENLRTIAEAGIKLAIDDYGSGFSSLSYLQQLPVSELKIDKMFISGLMSGQRDPLLVRSTIELAHALEMEVTAEGVEGPEVAALLQVMGCDLLQGFHICRPLPLTALVPWLEARRDAPANSQPQQALLRRFSRGKVG